MADLESLAKAMNIQPDQVRNALARPIVSGQPIANALAQSGDSPMMANILGLYHALNPFKDATVGDLGEQAAYATPGVGNALSAKDAANAYGDRNWLGVGLGALGAVPFLGGATKMAGKASSVEQLAGLRSKWLDAQKLYQAEEARLHSLPEHATDQISELADRRLPAIEHLSLQHSREAQRIVDKMSDAEFNAMHPKLHPDEWDWTDPEQFHP